jgi:hypothetical protein
MPKVLKRDLELARLLIGEVGGLPQLGKEEGAEFIGWVLKLANSLQS